MGNHYVYVGSITNAMRGRYILEAQGVRSFLQRTPTPAEDEGCGYRLLITSDVQRAVALLRENGVRIVRVTDAM